MTLVTPAARKPRAPALAISRPRSLTATVLDRLRQAIIDSDFALGSELSEVALADLIGVSRTPVREALSLLQQQGLVSIIPQKGSYVFFPSEQDIIDLCEFRIVIEQRSVAFAMMRRRSETLESIRGVLEIMTRARADGDPLRYSRADSQFHEAFVANCCNRYIQDSYALVAGQIATLRTHLSGPLAGVQDRSLGEHRSMVQSFERGDLMGFENILNHHILNTREHYIRALKEGLISGGQVSPER